MRPKAFRSLALECVHLAQKSDDPERRSLLMDMAHSWADLANLAERFQRSVETAAASRPADHAPLSVITSQGHRLTSAQDTTEALLFRFQTSEGRSTAAGGVLESEYYPLRSCLV